MSRRIKYRVSNDALRGPFSTFERALKRARELRTKLGAAFDVLEIDTSGNETPVAHVALKRAPKIVSEPSTRYVL